MPQANSVSPSREKENLKKHRERHDESHGTQEPQEGQGRNKAHGHERHYSHRNQPEPGRRVHEKQPEQKHGGGQNLHRCTR